MLSLIPSSGHTKGINKDSLHLEKDIQEIVRSSQACTDAESVKSGKCFSKFEMTEIQDVDEILGGGNEKKKRSQTKVLSGKIIVFVSFGMPTASLKAIQHDVSKVGGRMVVRGLVGGSFKKTQKRMLALGISVDIDPPLFEKYEITKVPVIMNRMTDSSFDMLQGNIRLDSALEEFSKKGEYKTQAIQFLKKLRKET